MVTAHRPMLVVANDAWCLVCHTALFSALPTVKTKKNKVSILCLIGWIQLLLYQGKITLEWLTATVMVMADGDGIYVGQWWQRWQWQTARAMVMAMADSNAAETVAAMVDGNRNGNGCSNGDGWQRQEWQRSWQRQQRWQLWLQWVQLQRGQQWQREGCLFMCLQYAALWQVRHLATAPMNTKESAFTSDASLGWYC